MSKQPPYIVTEYVPYLKDWQTAKGWTPGVIKLLPLPSNAQPHMDAQYCDEVLARLVGFPDYAGIVLIGEQAWESECDPSDDATLDLLAELREQGFTGRVIYLTDLHITSGAKAPFLAAFPSLVIVRKTAITQGYQPLPL